MAITGFAAIRGHQSAWVLLGVLLILCGDNIAGADGIALPPMVADRIPEIPSQQAIIRYRAGIETLIIESTFDSDAGELAWLVPVPAKPTSVKKTKLRFSRFRKALEDALI
ncbi:MAG: hypothetical protein QG656_1084 [Candidatus Hydrogenedentes bacterium]|nr:hypothetical protein [Candidatus Hydrogenedentota bacterium]